MHDPTYAKPAESKTKNKSGLKPSRHLKDIKMIKLIFTLKITDENKYQEYRNKIRPLMQELQIVVLNEYRIAKTVHSTLDTDQVNLLAMFGFPDEDIRNKFFSSATYQDAKPLFDASTKNFSKLSE